MKTPIVLLIALTICACKRDDDEPAPETRPTRPAATAPAERKAVFPESEAAAVLRAISDAEVAIASVALDVTQSEAVLAYSRVVAADYRAIGRLVDSTTSAIGQAATENALSAEVRRAGDSISTGLRALSSGFNNTFIEEQVKANQRALQIMDTVLIPSARTPQLKSLFEAIRPTLIAHLQRSMQILAERRKAAQERGEPWQSGLRPPAPAPPTLEEEPLEEQPDTVLPDTVPKVS